MRNHKQTTKAMHSGALLAQSTPLLAGIPFYAATTSCGADAVAATAGPPPRSADYLLSALRRTPRSTRCWAHPGPRRTMVGESTRWAPSATRETNRA